MTQPRATTELLQIQQLLNPLGLLLRGGFYPDQEDQVPLLGDASRVETVILAGNAGPQMWSAFQQARNLTDSEMSLNQWTEKGLSAIASTLDAEVVYPFGGPPFMPFQRWAQRAETVFPSPIGPLIHPQFGLWHAYRGAFLFPTRLALPQLRETVSPCETCQGRPCLSSCPVAALKDQDYDVAACRNHLHTPEGKTCLGGGCLARHACPIGQDYRYMPPQAGFHMRAFLKGN
jgi:hypothetical protein